MSKDILIELPKLHIVQQKIKDSDARFKVVCCGRRFGKSFMAANLIAEPAIEGMPTGYFTPNYKDLVEVWASLKSILKPVANRISEQEHRIELLTGGLVECWTLENVDAGRSRKYKRVVLDEAAKCRQLEQCWLQSIRPTLTDYQGDAYFYSTPKGRNYFYQLFLLCKQYDNWQSWQLPTIANPTIPNLEAEIEEARLQMPEQVFAQEYLAQFIEDSGSVFRGVIDAIDINRINADAPDRKNRRYALGIDLAKYQDFTVLTLLDDTGRQVLHVRFNNMSWNVQIEHILDVIREYKPYTCVDSTGVGDAVVEQLRYAAKEFETKLHSIEGVVFTPSTKGEMIENLALDIERGRLRLMDIPVQTNELLSYEYERTDAGNLKMNAAPGFHDDCVISLALANKARRFISTPEQPAEKPKPQTAEWIMSKIRGSKYDR